MKTGAVKWYESAVGLGFIEPDEPGRDILFSQCVVHGDVDSLTRGATVRYDVRCAPESPVATRVVTILNAWCH